MYMYSQSSAVICEEEEVVSCCRGHSLGMFNAAAVALALYPFNYFYGSYSTRGQCFVVTEGWSVPLTIGHFIWTLSCVNVTSMKHLYWPSWSVLKVIIVLCLVNFVCIDDGDDERKELINSLSGSRDAHLDGNPQGTAWVTRGCGSGATTASPPCVCTVQRDAYVFKCFIVSVSAYKCQTIWSAWCTNRYSVLLIYLWLWHCMVH